MVTFNKILSNMRMVMLFISLYAGLQAHTVQDEDAHQGQKKALSINPVDLLRNLYRTLFEFPTLDDLPRVRVENAPHSSSFKAIESLHSINFQPFLAQFSAKHEKRCFQGGGKIGMALPFFDNVKIFGGYHQFSPQKKGPSLSFQADFMTYFRIDTSVIKHKRQKPTAQMMFSITLPLGKTLF